VPKNASILDFTRGPAKPRTDLVEGFAIEQPRELTWLPHPLHLTSDIWIDRSGQQAVLVPAVSSLEYNMPAVRLASMHSAASTVQRMRAQPNMPAQLKQLHADLAGGILWDHCNNFLMFPARKVYRHRQASLIAYFSRRLYATHAPAARNAAAIPRMWRHHA
jgi:hypothetical protein